MMLSRSLQLRLQHLSRTIPWAAASPYLQQHTADLRDATLTLFRQPDPRTAGLSPTATDLQLHLPLREGGLRCQRLSSCCACCRFHFHRRREVPLPSPPLPPTCTLSPHQPAPRLHDGASCILNSPTCAPCQPRASQLRQPRSSPGCPPKSATPSEPPTVQS
jgi:hypothetical protein